MFFRWSFVLPRFKWWWCVASFYSWLSSWLFPIPFGQIKSSSLAQVSTTIWTHFSSSSNFQQIEIKICLFQRYKEAAVPCALWLEQSLNAFRESLLDLCQPNRASAHPPLERSTAPQQNAGPSLNDTSSNAPRSSASAAAQAASTKQILDNFNKLMSACVVLRIENFMLYRVTTSGKKSMPKEFISGENT